jgi:TonB family protein
MRHPARRTLLRGACGAVSLAVVLTTTASAQSATLQGVVADSATGVGVAGAEVRLGNVRAVTDASGAFRLNTPFAAGDTLHVRRLGYGARRVALQSDTLSALRVALAALPHELSPTVVQAVRPRYAGRLAGYYERLESRTTGQFITRAELEQDQQGLLSHILQHSPNVQVRRGRGVPLISMRGKECRPLVWLDGNPMASGTVDLDAFPPRSLHGVELYLGSVSTPQQFQGLGGKSECGTILLWSRGPDTDPVGQGSTSSAAALERLIAQADIYTVDQVDTAALAVAPQLSVTYPPLLRATGVTGTVIAEFVVDTAGLVDESTISFVASSHAAFSEAVRVALMRAAFKAAQRDGRRVRQLVRQRFNFGT